MRVVLAALVVLLNCASPAPERVEEFRSEGENGRHKKVCVVNKSAYGVEVVGLVSEHHEMFSIHVRQGSSAEELVPQVHFIPSPMSIGIEAEGTQTVYVPPGLNRIGVQSNDRPLKIVVKPREMGATPFALSYRLSSCE